ncbi:MAG TPA: hypothetical protein VNC11_02900 [Gemmatimonadaceae bacterium]|nr:hypothetical protein [Gemmatimonadaceae bacterium]
MRLRSPSLSDGDEIVAPSTETRPQHMRLRIDFLLGLVLIAGCSDKPTNFKPRSEMTQREKDSTLGASSLPGAPVVTRALGASDVGAARAAALDSASQEN